MKYIVFARIANKDYMVTIDAQSAAAAEHAILDLSYCGIHRSSVQSSLAFGFKEIKTDSFVGCVQSSTSISYNELAEIIKERNLEIEKKDVAERRIQEIEKQMQKLAEELESAKRILAA